MLINLPAPPCCDDSPKDPAGKQEWLAGLQGNVSGADVGNSSCSAHRGALGAFARIYVRKGNGGERDSAGSPKIRRVQAGNISFGAGNSPPRAGGTSGWEYSPIFPNRFSVPRLRQRSAVVLSGDAKRDP